MSCTDCTPPFKSCWHSSVVKNSEHSSRTGTCLMRSLSLHGRFMRELSCQMHFAVGSDRVAVFSLAAMKRTAFQAGFPIDRQIVRVNICVPPDRCTRNEQLMIPLACCNTDSINTVKYLLTSRIKEITGRRPRLECFQPQQNGVHFPYTLPITSLATLDVVHFVRTAAD